MMTRNISFGDRCWHNTTSHSASSTLDTRKTNLPCWTSHGGTNGGAFYVAFEVRRATICRDDKAIDELRILLFGWATVQRATTT